MLFTTEAVALPVSAAATLNSRTCHGLDLMAAAPPAAQTGGTSTIADLYQEVAEMVGGISIEDQTQEQGTSNMISQPEDRQKETSP